MTSSGAPFTMALLRRRLRCHYCNVQSRDSVLQIPKTYHCPHCDAVNHFDQRGNITDPPIEEIATAPATAFQYMRSRSPTPAMQAPVHDDIFCGTCQRNQTIYTRLVGNFIPDEDDPHYEKYVASMDDYKAELELRYPQVCQTCQPRVQQQIRNANHVARADNLARIMEASKKKRTIVHTGRQAWTLRIISLAKWTYVLSTGVEMLWHAAVLFVAPDDGMLSDQSFGWGVCLSQAIFVRSVNKACVLSSPVVKWLQYAIIADLATIWWNPKLKLKTNSLTGRMRGLTSLWSIRLAVVVLRSTMLFQLKDTDINTDMLLNFQITHMTMLVVLALSTILTWTTVRIVYGAAPSFAKAIPEIIPASPSSAQKARRNSYHPVHPQADIYDSMAHSFATGIEGYQNSSPCPPSPTLTESSYTSTHATDATTPFAKRDAFLDDFDTMDWTPTKGGPRFSRQQQQEIIPNQFSKQAAAAAVPQLSQPQFRNSQPQQQHSLFAEKDPNPFRHRVPAKPPTSLASAQKLRQNPWKPSAWDPPLDVNKKNFFKEEQKARGGSGGSGVDEVQGLDGLGVPKNVKRDAELFASPKLKYDYYGTMKDTGLEDTFNAMFSK
ncbi:Integral inner nuclear membrane ima1 [Pyrenophora seminiperda CCB06]|uniref:Integral inner nuclear membrane ima1 n=1 Tax=Pyrenophora seminiperda CCB06 TaxID=1302712 RepID=A0A3M7LVA8_9PLEO|nr:Integral inner nuclear membrane ima1 [Pyrenophora seminiperda CCB06]